MNVPEPQKRPVCFLFDNGSLRAEATLWLRRTASALTAEIGAEVRAVSLLHSSGINPAELGGMPAHLLEPALMEFFAKEPEADAVLLPLFFGPSGALSEYLPGRIDAMRRGFPRARIRVGRCLVDSGETDTRIALCLRDAVLAVMRHQHLNRPKVALVDHGSPVAAVTGVRNHLGRQLRDLLGGAVESVTVASMERRPGPEYSFNDPLLAELLHTRPHDTGDVIVALQFLAPGRHAGPEGDIARICAQAGRDSAGLRTYMTEPIANDARIVAVLGDRYRQVLAVG